MKTGTVSRAKHLLHRYIVMQEQVKAGEIALAKIDDNENPSDYLSKWVNKHKMQRSDAYAINPSAAWRREPRRQGASTGGALCVCG